MQGKQKGQKELETELGWGRTTCTKAETEFFKGRTGIFRADFEAIHGVLDYRDSNSLLARRCAEAFCDTYGQRFWPSPAERAGTPIWPEDERRIVRALMEYFTVQARYIYIAQHSTKSKIEKVVGRSHDRVHVTRGKDVARRAHVIATHNSLDNSRQSHTPRTLPLAEPRSLNRLNDVSQQDQRVQPLSPNTLVASASKVKARDIKFDMEFESKAIAMIKSLDPELDTVPNSGASQFSRSWLTTPNSEWPAHPSITRRLKRMIFLYDAFTPDKASSIGKILRNKTALQQLSIEETKEFNTRLVHRIQFHVSRMVEKGFVGWDDKMNKLVKTEEFNKLWVQRFRAGYWKRVGSVDAQQRDTEQPRSSLAKKSSSSGMPTKSVVSGNPTSKNAQATQHNSAVSFAAPKSSSAGNAPQYPKRRSFSETTLDSPLERPVKKQAQRSNRGDVKILLSRSRPLPSHSTRVYCEAGPSHS